MKPSPTAPATPHQLVSHHIHQLAKAAAAAHHHARTRAAAAYAESAAPPVDQPEPSQPATGPGGAA